MATIRIGNYEVDVARCDSDNSWKADVVIDCGSFIGRRPFCSFNGYGYEAEVTTAARVAVVNDMERIASNLEKALGEELARQRRS